MLKNQQKCLRINIDKTTISNNPKLRTLLVLEQRQNKEKAKRKKKRKRQERKAIDKQRTNTVLV